MLLDNGYVEEVDDKKRFVNIFDEINNKLSEDVYKRQHVGSATVISHSTPYDKTSWSSVFKTKSDIGLNVPSEVAKQLLYLLRCV